VITGGPGRRISTTVPVAVAAAWAVALVAQTTGNAGLFHVYDYGFDGVLLFWFVVLMLLFWVMVVVFFVAW